MVKAPPRLSKQQQALQAIAKGWRQATVLHAGDNIRSNVVNSSLRHCDVTHVHKNTWDITGLSKEMWNQAGERGSRRSGDCSHTDHTLTVLTGFAQATRLLQSRAIRDQFTTPALNDQIHGIFLSVSHDATPFFMRFGPLRGELEPWARYLYNDGDCWMSVTYEQYRQLKGTNAPTTAGILELMGVGAEFYWSGQDDSLHRRDAFSPPLILEKANATVSFAATTRGIEGVSVQDIIAISRRQRSLIYSEMTDAASYIKRMVYAKACRLSFNCFCPMLFCAVHRLHRIAVGAADEDAYIGNVHAIEFVGKQSQKRKAIYEAAEQLIDEEMLILEYPPPPEVAAHTHRVLEHTFERREGIVRGRLGSELFERRSQSVSERVNLCKRFLNGDLTMPTVVHHEVGCCTDAEGHFSRAACVQNVANAVQQSGLLGGDLQGDVSKDR